MNELVLVAPSCVRTDASTAFAPSAVARTSALRDSPSLYESSRATFSTVASIAVARDKLEKLA